MSDYIFYNESTESCVRRCIEATHVYRNTESVSGMQQKRE